MWDPTHHTLRDIQREWADTRDHAAIKAILNRLDAGVTSLSAAVRALRSQFDRFCNEMRERLPDDTNRSTRYEMAMVPLIDEREASAEVRAVFDDIKASRNTDWINNFWRALANHPPSLQRTWESLKEVMAPGALDPLTKELVYLAVSISNGCQYCTASHGAAAKRLGMSQQMLGELVAVVGMANETNRLADGYRVPVDERFEKLF